MGRHRNKNTGVVVSVDDSKDDRFASDDFEPADEKDDRFAEGWDKVEETKPTTRAKK